MIPAHTASSTGTNYLCHRDGHSWGDDCPTGSLYVGHEVAWTNDGVGGGVTPSTCVTVRDSAGVLVYDAVLASGQTTTSSGTATHWTVGATGSYDWAFWNYYGLCPPLPGPIPPAKSGTITATAPQSYTCDRYGWPDGCPIVGSDYRPRHLDKLSFYNNAETFALIEIDDGNTFWQCLPPGHTSSPWTASPVRTWFDVQWHDADEFDCWDKYMTPEKQVDLYTTR